MAKQGVRSAVVMNWAGLEPAYLTEPWWKEVGNALDAARSAGLTHEIPERPISFAPASVPFTLASWTGSGLAHYSGSAHYETEFTLDALPAGERIVLDLGSVGLAAEVWVNDRKAGERACRPFEIDVTAQVRPGSNRLRVRVANSNAGWMAQGDPIYERGAWGVKFASERDRLQTLRPNGLEGPVRLVAVKP